MPELYRNQDYKALRKSVIAARKLFEDPEFPATSASLFFDPNRRHGFEWKRPGEIADQPKLFVDGVSVDDVTQGVLGNCWFVSACSALTRNKSLLQKVIPDADDQEWDKKRPEAYGGIFHFSFWQFGRWVDVVIDDRLPTQNGKLVFARSKTQNEFWSALLEKAFAKLFGCYESLVGGQLAEALQDLSGGIPQTIELTGKKLAQSDEKNALFFNLKDAFRHKALIAAAIASRTSEDVERTLDCGLVVGHAYAVTDIRTVDLDAQKRSLISLFPSYEKKMLLRLQNPWGAREWNGSWSDGSSEWNQVTDSQKQELGITVNEDGEFWMTWDDFCRYFTDVSVCHMVNTSIFSFSKRYNEVVFHGEWRATRRRGELEDRAGGCANHGSFLFNPQFRFEVKEDDEPVMLSLTQQDVRERRREKVAYLTVGMHVMRLEENRKYRIHQAMEAVSTSDYINARSVFLCLRDLRPGRYVVLPTTYAPAEEGRFMLRIYTTYFANPRELVKHKPTGGKFASLKAKVACVTRLKVVGAQNLVDKKGNKGIDPYCIVTCEEKEERSPVVKNNASPHWDFVTIFYRRKPQKPIKIELWDSNVLRDSFLGMAIVKAPIDNEKKRIDMPLTDKPDEASPTAFAGRLTVEIATYDDPLFL